MSSTVLQFVSGLKSRHRDVQNKAAQDLFLYVKTELREMNFEDRSKFFDDFNHHIFNMVSSPDAYEKKGGVLAISMYNSYPICCFFYQLRRYNLYVLYMLIPSHHPIALNYLNT